MKYQEVKSMFDSSQLKTLINNGVLKGVTTNEALTIGFTVDEVKALVIAKKVIAPREKKVSDIKVTEKGALSVYGLQRFPVTLYADQWKILLDNSDLIRNALSVNASRLATKVE